MDAFITLFLQTLSQVWITFTHNWPFLVASVLVAVGLKLYLDPQKVSGFLTRHKRAGVIGATVAAVGTPLCSCGTTAVILGMMASMIPWAPIVAFMVASPLTSPEELLYSAGLFGWPFAITFFVSSILLGLLGGAAAGFMEGRGWLKNQTRLATPISNGEKTQTIRRLNLAPSHILAGAGAFGLLTPAPAPAACGCGSPVAAVLETEDGCPPAVTPAAPAACACTASLPQPSSAAGMTAPSALNDSQLSTLASPANKSRVTPRMFLAETFTTGKRLLLMFVGFAFIGYFLNGLIPPAWVSAVFGGGSVYSVPLAATLGLPLYLNSEASLPLVRALLDGGMSQGAALAFLITGAGTSVGAIAGALTIARWRVIALVIGTLWVGATLLGLAYNLWLN